MSAYCMGLTGKAVLWAVHKQKGHRSASRTAMMHLDAEVLNDSQHNCNFMFVFHHPNLVSPDKMLQFSDAKFWPHERVFFDLFRQRIWKHFTPRCNALLAEITD